MELRNEPEVIEIIEDFFYNLEDFYGKENITCELTEVVLNNDQMILYEKKSKNKYRCSKARMKKDFKKVSIKCRVYNTLMVRKDPEAKNYSKNGIVNILLVTIKNIHESKSITPFDIVSDVTIACERLEREFNRKFKLMFYNNRIISKKEIIFGIVTQNKLV